MLNIYESIDTNSLLMNVQDEVAAAQPDIDKRTEQLVSKGRWAVPGYKASLHCLCCDLIHLANYAIGEIRRLVRSISVSLILPKYSQTGCTTYCE